MSAEPPHGTSRPRFFVTANPKNHMRLVLDAAVAAGLSPVMLYSDADYREDPDLATRGARFVEVADWTDVSTILSDVEAATRDGEIAGTYAVHEYTLAVDAHIRASVGLPHTTPEAFTQLLDKHWVRRRLIAEGLSRIRVFGEDEFRRWSTWPEGLVAYLKPSRGGGSAMVTRCTGIEDLRRALREWDARTELVADRGLLGHLEADGAQLVLEEEIEGILFSAEGFYDGQRYLPLGLSVRQRLLDDPSIEMGSLFPFETGFDDRIFAMVAAIHDVLPFAYGPSHVEMILSPDGVADLVEINVRFGGAQILKSVNIAYGRAFQSVLLDSAMGRLDLPDSFGACRRCAGTRYILPPRSRTHVGTVGFPADVVDAHAYYPASRPVDEKRSQLGHIGYVLQTADSLPELVAKLDRTIAATTIDGERLVLDADNIVEDPLRSASGLPGTAGAAMASHAGEG